MRALPLEREGRSLWRYMSFPKLEDLITHRHLLFTRLSHMVETELDAREGALGPLNFSRPDIRVRWMLTEVLGPPNDSDVCQTIERQFSDPEYLKLHEGSVRQINCVNCWFMDEFESEGMWGDYAKDGDGVVIHTTIRRLRTCFDASPGTQYMQPVIYYDPLRETVPPDSFLAPFYKVTDFRREHEFRAMVFDLSNGDYVGHPDGIGLWVPCDVPTLVGKIRVAPGSGPNLLSRVHKLLDKNALGRVPVGRSDLEVGLLRPR